VILCTPSRVTIIITSMIPAMRTAVSRSHTVLESVTSSAWARDARPYDAQQEAVQR
jgi:hypothetical protein